MANYKLTKLAYCSARTSHLRRSGGALCIGVLLGLSACSKQPDVSATARQPKQHEHADEIDFDLIPLQNLVNAQRRKSLVFAEALILSIEQFLQTPNKTQHTQAQDAWLKAHGAYSAASHLPLPALVSLDSEISLAANQLQYQLDAWPIEPGYIDSLAAHPGSGIISDITVPMTPTSLQQQHGFTDVQEVSMGFHALEYLIFARDLQDFQVPNSSATEFESDVRNRLKHEIILRRRDALRIITKQISLDLSRLFAMNQQGYTGLGITTGSANRATLGIALSIVQRLRETSLQIIDDIQRSITADVGHGDYSATGQQLLAAELISLQLTLFEPVNLAALVAKEGARTVDTLRTTLAEASRNANGETSTDADRARLALLVAALPHLLDDLARLISQTPVKVLDKTADGS
jgi:hypothetical protein